MVNEESDDMEMTAPTKVRKKKQSILEQAKKKYEDKEKTNALINVGGSLSTKHNFDVIEISNDLRGKH
ncbi:hypothetical protein [Niallia sp. 01092]|uniref:hypothetical protein n=1 Tax=unclassified Niallia TaxID=2837522 RepID=UPI003FCF6C39